MKSNEKDSVISKCGKTFIKNGKCVLRPIVIQMNIFFWCTSVQLVFLLLCGISFGPR